MWFGTHGLFLWLITGYSDSGRYLDPLSTLWEGKTKVQGVLQYHQTILAGTYNSNVDNGTKHICKLVWLCQTN